MTVRDWKAELEHYDEDAEVVFEIDDDIEPETVMRNRHGWYRVHLDSKLKEAFICEIHGDCRVELEVNK